MDYADRISIRFALSLVFRLINAFSIATFFQPDEYYQAWEPAYADVYGIGFRSWEWQAGIRTSLMPRLFAAIIRISVFFNISHLVLGKILMAIAAAIGDVATSSLAGKIAPKDARRGIQKLAWFVSLGSMFNWYCSTRPFSNTFEMVLVVCALNLWQANNMPALMIAQIFAHIAIALRPSDGLFWLILGIDLLWNARGWRSRLQITVLSFFTAIISQGAILLTDQNYYKHLQAELELPDTSGSLAMLEFLRHNFGSRVSEIYGVLPWHWYITQGVPFLLLGYLPFAISGWLSAPRKWKWLLAINVLAFSCIAHKEFRFIYFLLPLMHVMVAIGLERMTTFKFLRNLAFAVNIIVAFYFTKFHQRGVIDVIRFISDSPEITDVSFLMPCHSTPWHAHFNRESDETFAAQFLTCDPPWNCSSVGYVDEADQFYLNPEQFLLDHPEKLTETVVAFEPLRLLLEDNNYTEVQSFYNGLFNEDSRRHGRVIVFKANQE